MAHKTGNAYRQSQQHTSHNDFNASDYPASVTITASSLKLLVLVPGNGSRH